MKKMSIMITLCVLLFSRFVIAEDKSTLQTDTINNALYILAQFKGWEAEKHLSSGKCSNEVLDYDQPDKMKFIEKITATDDCALNVVFKETASIPDLSKETLTFKMIIVDDDIYTWSCSFSGKNKHYLPANCK